MALFGAIKVKRKWLIPLERTTNFLERLISFHSKRNFLINWHFCEMEGPSLTKIDWLMFFFSVFPLCQTQKYPLLPWQNWNILSRSKNNDLVSTDIHNITNTFLNSMINLPHFYSSRNDVLKSNLHLSCSLSFKRNQLLQDMSRNVFLRFIWKSENLQIVRRWRQRRILEILLRAF